MNSNALEPDEEASPSHSASVGGFTFIPHSHKTPLPADDPALNRASRILQEAINEVQPENLSNNIIVAEGNKIGVLKETQGSSPNRTLCLGQDILDLQTPDEQLRGVIFHELAHLANQSYTKVNFGAEVDSYLDGQLGLYELKNTPDDISKAAQHIIEVYSENPLVSSNEAIPHMFKNLHKQQYQNIFYGAQLNALVDNLRQNPILDRIADGDDTTRSLPDAQLVDEVLNDMESTNSIRHALIDNSPIITDTKAAIQHPIATILEKSKKIPNHPASISEQEKTFTAFDQADLQEAVESYVDKILAVSEGNTANVYALQKMGRAIQWAEELRCDRSSALNTTSVDSNGGKTDNPFSVIEYLAKSSSNKNGSDSHPDITTRAENVADTAAGQRAEQYMATGAPEEDAYAMATAKTSEELEGLQIAERFPDIARPQITRPEGRIHPLNTPETRAAQQSFAEAVQARQNTPYRPSR
ncbi:MAG: hypothetical protein MK052_06260 [Alphaproteobacteria bacterium]|nr:hypothetical protein [Alphaproteobacteria bacterium]